MKKLVILEHGGGELANQLWNYASVYAYALEKGVILENPSFFEYGSMFQMPRQKYVDILFYSSFRTYRGRRNACLPRLWRLIYKIYAAKMALLHKGSVLSSINSMNQAYYLPPTKEADEILSTLEKKNPVYLKGWLFRNPKGLEKYRKQIEEYFRPRKDIEDEIHAFVENARRAYDKVVGVHIRQGDYKIFKGGAYYVEQTRIREILDEYLSQENLSPEKTKFIICSDGKIDQVVFKGLQIEISKFGAIHDLFLLSKTDAILGSNSSFSDFAAWYGNIPHIVFKKESMDWSYYKDKKEFFENKYCTMVQY
jgi:hypothetical protein